MSSLCSAHFGKNIFRLSTRKVPKKPPAPTPCIYEEIGRPLEELVRPPAVIEREEADKRSDEVYGFLPEHDLGSTMSLARSYRSLSSSRISYKMDNSFKQQSVNMSGHSSGYSSESAESSPSGSEGSPPPSTRSTSSRYPRSADEISTSLEGATMNNPANIPLFVSREHIAPDDWTGKPEVSVHRGMIVNALFKSFDWVYVKTAEDREGFIPLICVKRLGKSSPDSDFTQQYPEDSPLNTSSGNSSMYSSTSSLCSEESIVLSMKGKKTYDPDLSILEDIPARRRSPVYLYPYPELDLFSTSSSTLNTEDDDDTISVTSSVFSRFEGARLSVLFDYNAIDQDDISVRRHEVVTLLNDEDPDWIWVQTMEGREGFIPRSYAADLQALQLDPDVKTTYF